MDAYKGKLVKQVDLYKHLYDPSMRPQGQPNDFEFGERGRHCTDKIWVFLLEGVEQYEGSLQS